MEVSHFHGDVIISWICLLKDHGDSDHIRLNDFKAFLNTWSGSNIFGTSTLTNSNAARIIVSYMHREFILLIIYGDIFSHPTHGINTWSHTHRILWLVLFVVNMKYIILCFLCKTNHTDGVHLILIYQNFLFVVNMKILSHVSLVKQTTLMVYVWFWSIKTCLIFSPLTWNMCDQ